MTPIIMPPFFLSREHLLSKMFMHYNSDERWISKLLRPIWWYGFYWCWLKIANCLTCCRRRFDLIFVVPVSQSFFLLKHKTFHSRKWWAVPDYVQHWPYPDSKVHGANLGPTWVLSAPDGPHVGSMNLAIRVFITCIRTQVINVSIFPYTTDTSWHPFGVVHIFKKY